jgi:preprotein translocase subunit SecB
MRLETRRINARGQAELFIDFDYKIGEIEEENNCFRGSLTFLVQAKAKVKNRILYKIDLEIEGTFAGSIEKLSQEKFIQMLEMNGLITLLHISRAYLISVTAQSGIQPPLRIPMVNVLKMRENKNK